LRQRVACAVQIMRGQHARQGQVEAEVLHDMRIAPQLQILPLLQGQGRFKASRQIVTGEWSPERLKGSHGRIGKFLQGVDAPARDERDEVAEHRSLETL
jgi:hypothetical protein